MTNSNIEYPKVVSRDEWLVARQELLAKESDRILYPDEYEE